MASNRNDDTLKRIQKAFQAHRRSLDELEEALLEGFENQNRDGLELLSVQEVGERLGMGRSWVYQQVKSGQLPSIRLGGAVKVKREDLEDYIQNHYLSSQENE